MNDKNQSFSKEVSTREQGGLTWGKLRKEVDEFLREHDIPDDVQIQYFDFSGSNYGSVTVSYSDGALVIQ